MFSYPMNPQPSTRLENAVGNVRVLHAVPDAPNVDVYANDKLIAQNLAFGDYTKYMPLSEGNYRVSLYVAGTKDSPVLSNMLSIKKNDMLTVAACGKLNSIAFCAIPDANVPMQNNKAMVRFMHLSPDAPAVDITLPDGTVLFGNVSFDQATPYIAVDPSTYTLQARLAGTSNVALTVPDVKLDPNNYYTVFAIGLANGQPPLQALLTMDGKNKMS